VLPERAGGPDWADRSRKRGAKAVVLLPERFAVFRAGMHQAHHESSVTLWSVVMTFTLIALHFTLRQPKQRQR
jgi:hypothetical protein